jgi:DNA-binding GntR family transcriptional regulator
MSGMFFEKTEEDPMPESMRVARVAAPVREQALANLRMAITNGDLRAGDRLVERDLCERLGVSRTSVREALRQLESEGLVAMVPAKGPIVARLSVEQAVQIYEVRAALEALAGRCFCERATERDLAALIAAVDAIARAVDDGDPRQVLAAKDRFYTVLFDGSGNAVIQQMLRPLHARVTLLRATSLADAGRPAEALAEIRQIVEAIVARDADAAAKACATHVQRAAQVALAALTGGRNPEPPDSVDKASD